MGLYTYGLETKISLYADDATFPLQPQKSCLDALIKDLEDFSILSGLKPNYEKCTFLRIGYLKCSNFQLPCSVPIKWTDGPISVLGVHIPKNIKHLANENYENRLEKIDKILLPWKGKALSLYGKVTLINTLIVSQFVHLFMSLPSPDKFFF